MKKSRLRKQSKAKISTLQRKIWALVRQIVFKTYGTDCYTCDAKKLVGANLQCGHMWAKASLGAYLKYDTRVLRPQCARDNLFLGGRGADFYKRMLSEIGPGAMAKLESDRHVLVRAYDHYEKLLALYTEKVKNL